MHFGNWGWLKHVRVVDGRNVWLGGENAWLGGGDAQLRTQMT